METHFTVVRSIAHFPHYSKLHSTVYVRSVITPLYLPLTLAKQANTRFTYLKRMKG